MAQRIRVHSENNEFQHVEVLRRNREKRNKHQEFFVEGVKSIELALAHGWKLTTLVSSTGRPLSEWASRILRESGAPKHLELTPPLMQKLSEKQETSELIALVQMRSTELDALPLRKDACIVVLDRPTSPGNLGTILRSASSLGVDGVIITGHATDLYDPKVARASVGTLFTLPIVRLPSSSLLEPWLETLKASSGATVVGTTAKSTVNAFDHDFAGPTVLLFGNETHGLSKHYKSLCDALVTIPLRGAASSLNVAAAASIVLYEVDRQRRRAAARSFGETEVDLRQRP